VTSPSPTVYREHPVFFAGGDGKISGVLTIPTRRPVVCDAAAILLAGGGEVQGGERNRMWVHLARRLAESGIPALRFDYRGVGESEGVVSEWWLDNPFTEDLIGAVRWLQNQGMRRLAMAGTCFGARTILAAAEQIDDLAGVALFTTPLSSARLGEKAATRFADHWTLADYLRRALTLRVLRRALDPRWREAYRRVFAVKTRRLRQSVRVTAERNPVKELRWVSPVYLGPVVRLARRRLPTLMFYGAGEEEYQDLSAAREAGLGRVIEESKGAIEVRTAPGVIHGYTTLDAQRITVETALAWITSCLAPEFLPAAEWAASATESATEQAGRPRESRAGG